MDKNKLSLAFLVFILIFTFFVLAEETLPPTQISQPEVKILTQNIDSFVDEQTKLTIYSFKQDGALKIEDNDYWNIQPNGVITASSDGNIVFANFTVNDKTTQYVFGNDKITIPANSKVIYKNGVLFIDSPEGSEIGSSSKISEPDANIKSTITQFNGKNLKLPNGAILQEGILSYKDGQFFINSGEKVRISGLDIFAEGNKGVLNLYFDKHIPRFSSFVSGEEYTRLKAETIRDIKNGVTVVPSLFELTKQGVDTTDLFQVSRSFDDDLNEAIKESTNSQNSPETRQEWEEIRQAYNDKLAEAIEQSFNQLEDSNKPTSGIYINPQDSIVEMVKAKAEDSSFKVDFLEGNPFIQIEGKDKFNVQSSGDLFRLDILDRQSESKIPKLTLSGEGIINDNGKSVYTDSEDKVYLKNNGIQATSTPIELFFTNKDGTSQNEKYLISNFREFAGNVPLDAEEFSNENYEGTTIPKTIKTSWTYNYPSEQELKEIYGFSIDYKLGYEFDKPEVIRQLTDFLDNTPPELISENLKINILPLEEFNTVYGSSSGTGSAKEAAAFINKFTGELYFKGESFSYGYLRHELAHYRQGSFYPEDYNVLMQEYTPLIKETAKLMAEKKVLDGGFDFNFKINPADEPRIAELSSQITQNLDKMKPLVADIVSKRNSISIPFENEWYSVVGGKEVYSNPAYVISLPGTGAEVWKEKSEQVLQKYDEFNTIKEEAIKYSNLAKTMTRDQIANLDADTKKRVLEVRDKLNNILPIMLSYADIPRYGFIRPYSASEIGEDIATYQEKIKDPSFFKDLINPQSLTYDAKYQQKLELLLKYNFMTQSEYDAIMKEAGLK